MAHEEVDDAGRLRAGELVNVVEHERERRAQLGQAVDQQREEHVRAGAVGRAQALQRSAAADRARGAQRAEQVGCQAVGVVVVAVEGEPGHGPRPAAGLKP